MAQFPNAIPAIADITPTQTLAQANHAAKHNQMAGEIIALATKLGVNGSTNPNSIDKRLSDVQTQVNNLGAGFGSNTLYEGEVPTGAIDGINAAYTTANAFITGTLKVYRNGIRLRGGGHDYTINGNYGFTMVAPPASGSNLLVDYSTSTGVQGNAQTLGGKTLAEIRADVRTSTLEAMYPVGSIYTQANVDTNPATLLGIGTWAPFGAGRVLVGVDPTQAEFDTIGETGGAKTHTLTTAEIPAHNHSTGTTGFNATGPTATMNQFAGQGTSWVHSGISISNTGGGGAHNNLQPYITVYMWRRTA